MLLLSHLIKRPSLVQRHDGESSQVISLKTLRGKEETYEHERWAIWPWAWDDSLRKNCECTEYVDWRLKVAGFVGEFFMANSNFPQRPSHDLRFNIQVYSAVIVDGCCDTCYMVYAMYSYLNDKWMTREQTPVKVKTHLRHSEQEKAERVS